MSFKKSAFIVLIVTALLTTGLPSYAQRLALIIGNSAYSGNASLTNPVNDAKDLAKVLRRLGFKVMLRQNLNQQKMEAVINQFGEKLRKNRGVGLFYFSGHGIQHNGENYLIPIGAKRTLSNAEQLRYKAVPAGYALATMKSADNKANFIFLDACRNSPFKSWFKGEMAAPGLASMPTVPGALIAYAASPGGVAANGEGRNSPYVKHLINWIQQPNLSINQVLRKVRSAVRKETYGVQSPGYYDELNDDFYFVQQQEDDFTPGKVFRDRLKDGSQGPEMVWIPAGTFRMGDIQGGGYDSEKPVHSVSVNRFSMGRYEVTVGEFRRFVNATRYKTDAEKGDGCYVYDDGSWGKQKDANWRNPYFSQKDNQPVVCVSWNDATAYTEWLSQQTGEQYRLPTEAEWEYAARAGTETKYWWGNIASHEYANYGKDKCCDGLAKGKDRWKYTSPVGSFQPNPFGLYDTVGNVWEWTCSEYENRYKGKEKQCLSKNRANNEYRLSFRGGAWYYLARRLRSAYRVRGEPAFRGGGLGFRVARL
ncbi:SUMF1/EgtB/PvdO family nonheme iron enzyme [Candidatus Parabeggiatoa sp. HSG14]|uniref:SUMF1/EgtB/PvdO family nonheme iron enzyme n=1 Tax=Candidatus Parabeggiatoa sp. HSG14 TaxID=3055593 RepID=UPI0025A8B09E|nr:SUMF1/EgtB/PvdO family nonheme iron enzyme [Thiotrichales bacterium HSG14]